MKRILILSLALALGLGAQAQRFEWAKGYASGPDVDIKGSLTDSLGNLYILGQCSPNSTWENGSTLIPSSASDLGVRGALIAKISPQGDLVWKKVIACSYCFPYDIKPVGDSAFAFLVDMYVATRFNSIYYLDTMINQTGVGNSWPDYPMNAQGCVERVLAMITLDFDGQVKEHHFLQVSFLDENGDDILFNAGDTIPYLFTNSIGVSRFDIDREGNIYLSRGMDYGFLSGWGLYTPDHEYREYSAADGTVTGVKYWCDRRPIGVVSVDSTHFIGAQILKFAPHFDTLLQHRSFFQENIRCGAEDWCPIKLDERGRLYGYMTLHHGDVTLAVDSTQNMTVRVTTADFEKGVLVVFSTDSLKPTHLVTLGANVIRPELNISGIPFTNIAFDHDSNLLFIQGYADLSTYYDTTNFYAQPTYNGVPLPIEKNAFFMAVDMDDYSLHSSGKVKSMYGSDVNMTHAGDGNLICKNNRVIMQSVHAGGVTFQEDSHVFPNMYYCSPGLNIFDYQGHVIGGVHYAAYPSNQTGTIALHDSILYVVNRLSTDATFGDIHVNGRGAYFVCIAKYVDTAFMHPYKSTDKDPGIRVEVVQEGLTVIRYPNPTTGHLTIVMNGRRLSRAYLAGADGKAQPLAVSPAGDDRYSADLSAFPDGSYTLILVSDPEHAYQSQVILQRR